MVFLSVIKIFIIILLGVFIEDDRPLTPEFLFTQRHEVCGDPDYSYPSSLIRERNIVTLIVKYFNCFCN
ncbi:hypothetical protein PUN28_015953 [Cardiocondyla obscurior]|uniref:Uncharacterized protein n=1 Tax=Cardiocondyla obscurior TaxID=286306 RepID=A0AAW2EW52_9HYME